MKMTKTDKPDITLFAICEGSVMLNDGTACMIYRGQIDLYLHHINSDTWYRVTHITKNEKKNTIKDKSKDSKNPF
jgi:hypothetical protein